MKLWSSADSEKATTFSNLSDKETLERIQAGNDKEKKFEMIREYYLSNESNHPTASTLGIKKSDFENYEELILSCALLNLDSLPEWEVATHEPAATVGKTSSSSVVSSVLSSLRSPTKLVAQPDDMEAKPYVYFRWKSAGGKCNEIRIASEGEEGNAFFYQGDGNNGQKQRKQSFDIQDVQDLIADFQKVAGTEDVIQNCDNEAEKVRSNFKSSADVSDTTSVGSLKLDGGRVLMKLALNNQLRQNQFSKLTESKGIQDFFSERDNSRKKSDQLKNHYKNHPSDFFVDLLLLNISSLDGPKELIGSSKIKAISSPKFSKNSPTRPAVIKPKKAEWSKVGNQITSKFLLGDEDEYEMSISQQESHVGEISIKKNGVVLETIDQEFASKLIAALVRDSAYLEDLNKRKKIKTESNGEDRWSKLETSLKFGGRDWIKTILDKLISAEKSSQQDSTGSPNTLKSSDSEDSVDGLRNTSTTTMISNKVVAIDGSPGSDLNNSLVSTKGYSDDNTSQTNSFNSPIKFSTLSTDLNGFVVTDSPPQDLNDILVGVLRNEVEVINQSQDLAVEGEEESKLNSSVQSYIPPKQRLMNRWAANKKKKVDNNTTTLNQDEDEIEIGANNLNKNEVMSVTTVTEGLEKLFYESLENKQQNIGDVTTNGNSDTDVNLLLNQSTASFNQSYIDEQLKDVFGDEYISTSTNSFPTTPLKVAISVANIDQVRNNIKSSGDVVVAFQEVVSELDQSATLGATQTIFRDDIPKYAKILEELIILAATKVEYKDAWAEITSHNSGASGTITDPKLLETLDKNTQKFLATILPDQLTNNNGDIFEGCFSDDELEEIKKLKLERSDIDETDFNHDVWVLILNKKLATIPDTNRSLEYSNDETDVDASHLFQNPSIAVVLESLSKGKTSNRYMEAFRLALKEVDPKNIDEQEGSFFSGYAIKDVKIDNSAIRLEAHSAEILYLVDENNNGYYDKEVPAPTKEDVQKYADFLGVTDQYIANVKLLEWKKMDAPSPSPKPLNGEHIAEKTLYIPEPKNIHKDSIWKDKDRGNKLKVVNDVYGVNGEDGQNAIEQTLFDIIAKVAFDQGLEITRVLQIIETAREKGGIKNKWEGEEKQGGHYSPDQADRDARIFSKKFQEECEACGILSGRGSSSRGLRTTFIPLSVTNRIENLGEDELDKGVIKVSEKMKKNLEDRKGEVTSKKSQEHVM